MAGSWDRDRQGPDRDKQISGVRGGLGGEIERQMHDLGNGIIP